MTTGSTITVTKGTEQNSITLDLNGHGICFGGELDARSSVIKVESGAALTLKDTAAAKPIHKITLDENGCAKSVETVSEAGSDTDSVKYVTGGYITGGYIHHNDAYGGGVTIEENAVFTMTAGTVCGNTYGYDSEHGGGGVLSEGSFVMSGGRIADNTAYYGGGVFVQSGTFTMSNTADITGNKADRNGGGVYVYNSGMFQMEGGEIAENTATIQGGGVYVDNGGTFQMKDGEIAENTATIQGGGVYVDNSGMFQMEGGKITGNTVNSDRSGGGVYLNEDSDTGATFSISGNPIITGNTAGDKNNNVCKGDRGKAIIKVVGKLTGEIGVSIIKWDAEKNAYVPVAGVLTSGLAGKGSDLNFFSDYAEYALGLNDDKEAVLAGDPVTITFDANGGSGTMASRKVPKGVKTTLSANTFSAPADSVFAGWNTKADGSGTSYDDKAVITITSDTMLYAQWAQLVSVPAAVKNLTYNGKSQTGVASGTGYTLTGNTATKAGDYTATATLNKGFIWSDDTTAAKTVNWSIARKAVTITAENKTKVAGEVDPDLTAKVDGLVNGEKDSLISYTLSRKAGETAGTYTITPSGEATQGNYSVTYKTGVFTITEKQDIPNPDKPDNPDNPDNPVKASKPELLKATSNSISVKTVEGVEYSIDEGKTWQTSGVFSGLEKNTEYSIIARYAAKDGKPAGEPSEALVVKTLDVKEEAISEETVEKGKIETKIVTEKTEGDGYSISDVVIPKEVAQTLYDSLSEEDQQKIKNGATFTVSLEIKEISNVSEDDKKTAGKAAGTVMPDGVTGEGIFLDISLFTQLGDEEKKEVEPGEGQMITITVQVPASFIPSEEGINRIYILVHLLDNGSAVIAKTSKETSFPVETDSLSSWYLTYADERQDNGGNEDPGENNDPGNTGSPAEKVITVYDNQPMEYSEETKGDFRFGYFHKIPFYGKAKPELKLLGEIKVTYNGSTYTASKIKVNKKKHLIQITGLDGADKDAVKAVKKATKGANGLLFEVNPYYVRDTDAVTPKIKKESLKSVKVKINGKDYKAKKGEFSYDPATKVITFSGNLAGSFKVDQ